MSTRMQPVDTIFVKFYRLVREIATSIGKQVELIVEGKEVELDKAVIEAITDPLIHMVRNSIDHGIESPERRVEAGKPPYGTIWISASHQAGQVRLVIRDDGAGIDIEKVKQKALSTGKLTPYQVQGMSEKELARLIFLPGISTVERVTEISGMGVGMDVVLSNLSRIGGVIDIHTDRGNGTTFEIKLPLTLAIIPGLLVTSGDECFAIPQVNVAELVRIPSEKAPDIIQKIGSAVLFRLRGELVPLITLQQVLGTSSSSDHASLCEGASAPSASAVKGRAVNIAMVNSGEMQYGINVDSFLESEEIVVKPLGRHLRDCRIYSGATILGNGTVALILDVPGICELLNLARVKEIAGQKMSAAVKVDSLPVRSFLVVSNSATQHCAFPVESVIRIERVQKSNIELTAGRPSIRYRDSNLPLMSLEEIAPLGPMDDTYILYIVVVKFKGREAGFMASQIVDIVETADPVDEVTFRSHGVAGSLLLLQKTTLIIDLREVESASPHVTERAQRAVKEVFRTPSVLIAEDSEFFLEQFDSLLKSAGYVTYLARDGLEALTILESQKVDLLLTDIEMPNMNGFDLAAEVRRRPNLAPMPIFAITSIAGESDERRGRELGINEYLVKLDREELLGKLEFWLAAKSK
ncbi:MAG: chemotaxis protein CheW [Candidatus Xenobiia bacterium LiM19]